METPQFRNKERLSTGTFLFVILKRVSSQTLLSRSWFLLLTKTQQTYWTNTHNLPGPPYENSAAQGDWSRTEVRLLKKQWGEK